jgi:hypothetical protein
MACTALIGVVGVSAASASTNLILGSGGSLNSGQWLGNAKTDSGYRLDMQTDGNLVVYSASNAAVWNSGTSGQPGNRAVMQVDGNFVIYGTAGQVRWQSVTNGNNGAYAAMQGDGNFVIYSAGGAALWNTNYDNKATSAIAWMTARVGSTALEGKCELAVESAFGTSGRYPTAIANYNARKAAGQIKTSRPIPRGALVFYNTSAAGHVAISRGADATVISTSAGGKIGVVPNTYFQNYLGWAYAPW